MENNPTDFLNESELFGLNGREDMVYATFWQRLGAYIVDCLVMFLVTTPVFMIMPNPDLGNGWAIVRDQLISNGVWLLYYVFMISSRFQGTLGKLAFGLKVMREDGNTLTIPQAFLRYIYTVVSLIVFGLGIISIFGDPKKRAWHDKWVGCVVVKG